MHTTRICYLCHADFIETPDCWCGPDEDLPLCRACRDEEQSYENMAQPVRLPNLVADNYRKHGRGYQED